MPGMRQALHPLVGPETETEAVVALRSVLQSHRSRHLGQRRAPDDAALKQSIGP